MVIFKHFSLFRNIPELSTSEQSWKSTKLTGLKVNLHFNETNGRYGFGDGKFLMILKYKPSEDVPNLAGRVVGYLPELPNEPSFHKDLCPNRFTRLCVKPNGEYFSSYLPEFINKIFFSR